MYSIYMPFESDLDDHMAVFNQFCVLGMIYMQFLCSDYVTDPIFKSAVAGYMMMIIFTANIVVNVSVGFYELFGPTILKLKRWRYRRLNRKASLALNGNIV
jgi:hypothetical protein